MRRHRRSIGAGITACLLLYGGAGAANTYYVSKSGSDSFPGSQTHPWATIQHAVNSVTNDGDVILVGGGTYSENVEIPTGGRNALTLKGGHDASDWSWDPADHPTIIRGSSLAAVLRLKTLWHHVTGFTITGGSQGIHAGPEGYAGTQYTFTHCTITNNLSHGIYLTGGWDAMAIENCLIVGNGDDGIHDNADNGQYENHVYCCTVADNAGDGYHAAHGFHRAALVRNCIFTGNGGFGFLRSGGTQQDDLSYSCLYGNTNGNLSFPYPSHSPFVVVRGTTLFAPPRFAAGGEYRLQAGSPCVGYGTDLSGLGVTNDLEGTARSAPVDMGCYESGYAAAARYADTYADAARADDTGAGTSWETARRTIGAALAVTTNGGTCHVAAGVYPDMVVMPRNVTVEGRDGDGTVISNSVMGAFVPEPGATLRRLTLTGAISGVYLHLANGTDNVTVDQCTLRGNTYGVDGSVDQARNWRATVNRCRVQDNTSHGLYIRTKGALTAWNCLVTGNGGHGIYIDSDNSWYESSVYYCTLADNTGSGYLDVHGYHRTTYLNSCIAAGNGGYGVARLGSSSYSDYIRYSCVVSNDAGDIVTVGDPPRLVVQAGMITNQSPLLRPENYALVEESPCVDAAEDIGITVDLAGVTRPVIVRQPPDGSGYDMGALEYVRPAGLLMMLR